MSNFEQQKAKFRNQSGFIAALDQSGGSTPKALGLYGIEPSAWASDAEMMDLMHAMRTRIITSPSFNGDLILGAILFEATMDREVKGRPTAEYLWEVKKVVPFLKVDKGLEAESDGVQRMKPGGKARLTCPPAIAYGSQGFGKLIPPETTLQFDIELIAVRVAR